MTSNHEHPARWRLAAGLVTLAAIMPLGVARAQSGPDSSAARAAQATAVSPWRASWISDRVPLKVGDVLMVVVDERTSASERMSEGATANRSQGNKFNADLDTGGGTADRYRIGLDIGSNRASRNVGEAGRSGGLDAVLTVRVTAIGADGLAQIHGARKLTVDGRAQEIEIDGFIRPQDVSASNAVPSSRIADAVITYKGKKIGPKSGLFGSLLNMIWP